MIDASRFAAQHSSFWAEHAPTTEHFVRRINLEYLERWGRPLSKPAGSFRAGLVAEWAFARFCVDCVEGGIASASRGDVATDDTALDEARARLRPLVEDEQLLVAAPSPVEHQQHEHIASSLIRFFRRNGWRPIVRPTFAGCGYLDASEGDVVVGATLYEVKAVERPVRGIDVRQLLTYAALDHAAPQHRLDRIGLFNPRRGTFFEISIDQVCREVAGLVPEEFFERVVETVSSSGLSR